MWNGEIQNIWNTSTWTEEPYTHDGRRYMADTPNGEWEIYRQLDGWRNHTWAACTIYSSGGY